MGDQLRSGISVDVSFVSGEIPSPAKLTAITAQLRRATSQLETAVGDIHSESYPYSSASDTTLSQAWGKSIATGLDLSGSAERKLDIANIARLIGPASNLNPKMIPGETEMVEDVPIGVNEFGLKVPVTDISAVTTTDVSLSNLVTSAPLLIDPGDWYVDEGGRVNCVTATTGGTITYSTNPNTYSGGMNYPRATFNVIPDPNQSNNGDGVTVGIADGLGRYPVSFPVITHQQSDMDGLSISLDDDDVNFEGQLTVPRVLNSNFIAGDEIPSGFMFLKNETTGEVYEDAVYYFNDANSISVGNVDLDGSIDAGHVFSVITVGTDITSSIDDLRNKLRHNHDRTLGEPYVQVSGIIGQYSEAGPSGAYIPSEMPGNPFAQYLHRDGYHGTLDHNINDRNAMRGNIVMGLTDGIPGSYVGLGESFGLYLGSPDGPYIASETDLGLRIQNDNGPIRITADSSSFVQVDGELITEDGLIGAGGGNALSLYSKAGSFTSNAIGGIGVQLTGLSSSVTDKEWYSGTLLLNIPGEEHWFPPNTSALSPNFVDPDMNATDETEFNFILKKNGLIWEFWVHTLGVYWPTADTINYRLTIWYLP